MDKGTVVKYAAAAVLIGSIGVLSYLGKVDVQVYVGLVMGALSGLGIHTVTATKGS